MKLSSSFFSQFLVMLQLLRSDFVKLKSDLKSGLFDAVLWPIKSIILFGYIMPGLGLPGTFGIFILIGNIVTMCFFGVFDNANKILADAENQGILRYELTLPISSNIIFARKIIIFALQTLLIGSLVYFIGAFLLGTSFSGIPIYPLKSALIFIVTSVFFASLTLLISGLVRVKSVYRSFYSTILYTLWDLGAYLFNWQTLYLSLPILAYIMLFNPITYSMEGSRAAVLGQGNFINYWLCLVILIFFIITSLYFAIKILKKRFDFI